jgi:beta-galactosidase GanA
MIIYGTQYYRPPFPASKEWKSDLVKIKESNFNTIKVWAVWSWIERRDREFTFSDLDALVDLCDEIGLNVVINTIPEGMPYWALRRHSDARYRTNGGVEVEPSGAANMPSGGSPGVCQDKDEVQELTCRFIARVVKRFSSRDNVIAFDVWNEPHVEPIWDFPEALFCYCPYSKARFVEWLKAKYASIDHLNSAWSRAYVEWADVLPPVRFGTYPDMIDWRLFWIENLGNWLEKRVAAAKEVADGKTIVTHVPFSGYIGGTGNGGLGQHLGDEFVLAKQVDKFGVTSFPKWLMQNDFVQHLVNLELVASASAFRGKEFWQSELQAGAGKWEAQGRAVPSPDEIRLWSWSAMASGAKGLLFWQWKPEPSGCEAPGFGITSINGELTGRTIAASECATLFNSLPGFDRAVRIPTVNGIYISRSADLVLHAANQGEHLYAKGLYGAYKACFDSGVPVQMVHADELHSGSPPKQKILYAPVPVALSDLEQAGLIKFVEAGGTLVMEACPGMFNEKGVLRREQDFLQELFELSGIDLDYADTIPLTIGKRLSDGPFTEIEGKYYRQDFSGIGPGVIIHGCFEDGRPAVFEHRFGMGRAVLIGSLPSLAVSLDGNARSAEFIYSWLDRKGYFDIDQLENEGNIHFRFLQNLNQCYITAVNYSPSDQWVKISFKETVQLVGKKGDSVSLKNGSLEFKVKKLNGIILHLTKK